MTPPSRSTTRWGRSCRPACSTVSFLLPSCAFCTWRAGRCRAGFARAKVEVVCGDRGASVQYEAMAMVGYRDDKETFLVDFEQKRWQHDAEQGARDGREPGAVAGRPAAADQDCPEAVVRRHLGVVPCALVGCPLCLCCSSHGLGQVMVAVLGQFCCSSVTRSRLSCWHAACGMRHVACLGKRLESL